MNLSRACVSVLCLLGLVLAGTMALATPTANQTSAICDQASARAAAASGVPPAVMQAITLTETGRRLDGQQRAWPWTVNMEGTGAWFATRDEALAYVSEHYARGARSFDVGCFQINYRWHGQAFASIEDMFDPDINAAYAGKFLTSLYQEIGSWSATAGAFHSRTPEFSDRYRARFDAILARLNTGDGYAPPPIELASAPAIPDAPRIPRVIPPPSKYGSVAAIDTLQTGRSLLTAPARALY